MIAIDDQWPLGGDLLQLCVIDTADQIGDAFYCAYEEMLCVIESLGYHK